jgi:hypothetical protein
MLIDDIAGNTLIVKRGWDGTVLAAHTTGATIYAPRTLTVTRGALGTTADIARPRRPSTGGNPPAPSKQLCVAEALTTLTAEPCPVRPHRPRREGSSERVDRRGLAAAAGMYTYEACGRKARTRAV